MSTAEIKASIEKMTLEERFFAAAYIQHLSRTSDPAFQALLNERMNRMDAGNKITLDQAQHIHRTMESEGL